MLLYFAETKNASGAAHTLIIQLAFFFKDIGWDILSQSVQEDKINHIRTGVTLIMLLGRRLLGRLGNRELLNRVNKI